MNERDELADILMADELIWGTAGQSGRDYALSEADAILAAGYRKSRTITTAEELDALPRNTVIRDAYGFVLQKGQYQDSDWYAIADETPFTPIEFPATVLWEPR